MDNESPKIGTLADADYWADNRLRPVMFAQAMEEALSSSEFDLVLEIGAHTALKGPASQNIIDSLGKPLPYTGILSRGANAVKAVSISLGFLWANLGNMSVDIQAYEEAMSATSRF